MQCPICQKDDYNPYTLFNGPHATCFFSLSCEDVKVKLNRCFESQGNETPSTLLRNSTLKVILDSLHIGLDRPHTMSYQDNWRTMYCTFGIPPTLPQLDRLAKRLKGLKIMEVGAGCGLFSAVLQAYGLDVRAVDPDPHHLRTRMNWGIDPDEDDSRAIVGATGSLGPVVEISSIGASPVEESVDKTPFFGDKIKEYCRQMSQGEISSDEAANLIVKATEEYKASMEKIMELGSSMVKIPSIPKGFTYTEIEQLSADEALQKYPDTDVLLIVWPDYTLNLDLFKGRYIIIQGEGLDGCTFVNIEPHLIEEWNILEIYDSPRFEGLNDCLVVYERPALGFSQPTTQYVGRDGQEKLNLDTWKDRALLRRVKITTPENEQSEDQESVSE